jgi:hypothetical protein
MWASVDGLIGVENGLVEPNPEVHPPEGLYTARTLVRDSWEVPCEGPECCRDWKLTKGSPMAHCEPVILMTPPAVEQPHVWDITLKLQDVIAVGKPNLSDTESRELEEILMEYGDIFDMDNDKYGLTDRFYHHVDTGEAQPIHQPSRRPPKNTGGCGWDSWGHATTWGYQIVQQPLVIPVLMWKNGDLQFCIDYRKLNDITKKDCFSTALD